MKSFLVIGAGMFGHHLVRELSRQKCETMVVDRQQEALEDLLNLVESAKIADCTNPDTLRSFDIPSFDVCFVCIGRNFQHSLEITSLLKELGAKKVCSKAEENIQAKFLKRIGADEVIYPEADAARRLAIAETSDSIFDWKPLRGEYGIYEITPRREWIGKTARQLDFRNTYHLNILAAQKGDQVLPMPNAEYEFKRDEHLVVLGKEPDVRKVLEY